MINPFNANTESLVNFATGVVLPEEVADALLASRSKGQEKMKTFVKKRIQTNKVSYWDAIPKLSIKTFSSMTKKVKVKAGDEKSITVHADRDLFGGLLIGANARQINLMEVLSYELSPIPCSLAHQDGSLRENTKSLLAGIIEKLVIVVPQLQSSPENTVYILDGMAVIQMIKSGRTATFGELAKHYFNTFTSPLSTHKCYCVHVVYDQYLDDCIKAGKRARRGSSSALEVYIGGPATPVPKQCDKCISNPITRRTCVTSSLTPCAISGKDIFGKALNLSSEADSKMARGAWPSREIHVLMWRI